VLPPFSGGLHCGHGEYVTAGQFSLVLPPSNGGSIAVAITTSGAPKPGLSALAVRQRLHGLRRHLRRRGGWLPLFDGGLQGGGILADLGYNIYSGAPAV
jgi:hypothetical protein